MTEAALQVALVGCGLISLYHLQAWTEAGAVIPAPGYPRLHGDRLEVVGTTATLIMDYNRVFILGREEEGEDVDLVGRYQECFTHAIREFVAGLRDGRRFETDRLDNLETLRLMESCDRAAGVEV